MESQKTHQEIKQLFAEERYEECLEELQRSISLMNAIYGEVNEAIIHDRCNRDKKLEETLTSVIRSLEEKSQFNDYRIWWAVAFLSHKIQKYEKALWAVNELLSCEISEGLELEAKIRKGYCLEALRRFEEAIDLFESLEGSFKKSLYNQYRAEINHGLGHFYNEKGRHDKSVSDLKEAADRMEEAASIDEIYYTCKGTLQSENKNYLKAIKIFNRALNNLDVKENDHIVNEIKFYKAEALSWIGEFNDAYKLFEEFENYCEANNNQDGKVHCLVYKIETKLREKTILELDLTTLKNWLEMLQNNQLSLYANQAIHDEWDKLRDLLESFIELKKLLDPDNENLDIKELNSDKGQMVTNFLKTVEREPKLKILTDKNKELRRTIEKNGLFQPYLGPSIIDYDIYTQNNELNLTDHNVLYCALKENLPLELAFDVYKLLSEKGTVIMWKGEENIEVPVEIQDRAFFSEDFKKGAIITAVLTVYEKVREELTEPFYLFGLAPTVQAPSYSSQTGDLDELIFPGGEND